jgi:hypothetical protein
MGTLAGQRHFAASVKPFSAAASTDQSALIRPERIYQELGMPGVSPGGLARDLNRLSRCGDACPPLIPRLVALRDEPGY